MYVGVIRAINQFQTSFISCARHQLQTYMPCIYPLDVRKVLAGHVDSYLHGMTSGSGNYTGYYASNSFTRGQLTTKSPLHHMQVPKRGSRGKPAVF